MPKSPSIYSAEFVDAVNLALANLPNPIKTKPRHLGERFTPGRTVVLLDGLGPTALKINHVNTYRIVLTPLTKLENDAFTTTMQRAAAVTAAVSDMPLEQKQALAADAPAPQPTLDGEPDAQAIA